MSPWLRLSRSARHLPLTRLSGEGAATVLVHTDGRGLPSGEYIGTVTGAGNGGSVVVSVVMRVRTEPELDDTEARVEPVDVPGDAWSTSYHLPPDQVLGRPLEPADLDLASRYPDQAFQDLRLVATTAAGVLYAAAAAPIPDGRGGPCWKHECGSVGTAARRGTNCCTVPRSRVVTTRWSCGPRRCIRTVHACFWEPVTVSSWTTCRCRCHRRPAVSVRSMCPRTANISMSSRRI